MLSPIELFTETLKNRKCQYFTIPRAFSPPKIMKKGSPEVLFRRAFYPEKIRNNQRRLNIPPERPRICSGRASTTANPEQFREKLSKSVKRCQKLSKSAKSCRDLPNSDRRPDSTLSKSAKIRSPTMPANRLLLPHSPTIMLAAATNRLQQGAAVSRRRRVR